MFCEGWVGDYREVGKHTGEQNVVGKRAPPGL